MEPDYIIRVVLTHGHDEAKCNRRSPYFFRVLCVPVARAEDGNLPDTVELTPPVLFTVPGGLDLLLDRVTGALAFITQQPVDFAFDIEAPDECTLCHDKAGSCQT